MLYIFCDEAIKTDSPYQVYLYSAVAFKQNKFKNNGLKRIEELRKGGASLLNSINETLKSTDGFALITHARVPENTLTSGDTWHTGDISGMSPNDFAWSASMIFTIAYIIKIALERKWSFKTVDVFYDTKSLRQDHRCAAENVLQKGLKPHVKQFLKRSNLNEKVNVRRVNAIMKAKPNTTPDKFQLGVWLADRIVRRYNKVINLEGESLIETKDLTQILNDTINDFLKKGRPIESVNQQV